MTIKVHFDNGDTITTGFSGTVNDAVKHYIDRPFTFGTGEECDPEYQTIARSIEFLDGSPVQRLSGGRFRRLKRVYSISKAYMERYDLYCKIRQTWRNESIGGFPADCFTDDFAYIES